MAQTKHTEEATIALENKIIYDMLKRIDEEKDQLNRTQLVLEHREFVGSVTGYRSFQKLS